MFNLLSRTQLRLQHLSTWLIGQVLNYRKFCRISHCYSGNVLQVYQVITVQVSFLGNLYTIRKGMFPWTPGTEPWNVSQVSYWTPVGTFVCNKKIFGIRIWRNVLEVLRHARIWRFCCIYGGASEGSVGHCGWRGPAPAPSCMLSRPQQACPTDGTAHLELYQYINRKLNCVNLLKVIQDWDEIWRPLVIYTMDSQKNFF